MTMVSSGEISLGGSATSGGLNRSVNIELGRSATATISMNDSAVRTLFGVASGAISMSQGYGKSNNFVFNQTISSNTTNYNLRNAAISAGWNQVAPLVATITINGGVYVSANSTGTPAFATGSSFPSGSTLSVVNNGFIVGMGGAGGNGASASSSTGVAGTAGSTGGLALSVSAATSVTNNGTIAGGGGGGGGGASGVTDGGKSGFFSGGGGGGGGGRSSAAANSSGGAGGVPTGPPQYYKMNGGGGGAGTVSSAGGGGVGGRYPTSTPFGGGNGGGGGGWGASGSAGLVNPAYPQDTKAGPYSGGSGGAAVSGNGNISWIATGTRLGAIT